MDALREYYPSVLRTTIEIPMPSTLIFGRVVLTRSHASVGEALVQERLVESCAALAGRLGER